NDTETVSLTQASTSVTGGSADSYTIHFTNPIDTSVTVSVPLNISLPGGLGGAEAADISPSFLADIDAAISTTARLTRSAITLTFASTFNATAGFTFSLPTADDSLFEGNETYTVTLATPTTNATGTGFGALRTSPTPPSTDLNDTETVSLTQASTS